MNTTNLSELNSRCFFWPNGQIKPFMFRSDSFYSISRLTLAINVVTSLVGATGNGLFLVVLLRTSSLHTPANILIGSLALADFLIGAIVQPQMCAFVFQENVFRNCQFVDALTFLAHMLACISGTTMAAISCERYVALFFHLRYTELVTNKRVTIVVLVIWIFWFTIDAVTFLGALVDYIHPVRGAVAIVVWSLCCIAILATYLRIFVLARYHQEEICQAHLMVNATIKKLSSNLKLAITMGYVISLSLLCYIPACVVYTLFTAMPNSGIKLFNAFVLTMSIQLMSSSFNPFMYCWRSQEIRTSMVSLFRALKERTHS